MGARPSRVKVVGPLVSHVAGFHKELAAQGYRPFALTEQLRVLAHVSRWLAGEGFEVGDLTSERIEEFLVVRRSEGYTLWTSTKGVDPLVTYLRGIGAAPAATVPSPSELDKLLDQFRSYLLNERGIARASTVSYVHVARLFLVQLPTVLDLGVVTPREVIGFVATQCELRNPAYIACGLRSFLRYCHLRGLTAAPLAGAVPRVANRQRAKLPKSLDASAIAALLKSCDRRHVFGRRDFAIITLLARLGLRAGEIVTLELDDIDWRAGELVIRGKGQRRDRLPLPTDVGAAIAAWLRHGRGSPSCRNVFTRLRAPRRPLTSSGVSAVVYAACRRVGVPEVGAHRLRHSAATEMLRAGASLEEIGQVLRHELAITTSLYARVDVAALAGLARPWPEVRP
jgi:integrase/recombinase XerD